MNKYGLLLLLILGITSCTVKDEQYYWQHPKDLQQALKNCPTSSPPKGFSCDEMNQLAKQMNELAYQLQYNPQGFGQQILLLQETIAQQEAALKLNQAMPETKSSLAKNKQNLKQRLAVVKWLESPES